MTSMLCISRHTPYGNALAREALETVLAAAAYEQDIKLLFMDDGVWQLFKDQQPVCINQKDITKNLNAMPIFGVEEIYAHEPSLQARGISRDSLSLNNVQLLTTEQTQALIASQQQILSF